MKNLIAIIILAAFATIGLNAQKVTAKTAEPIIKTLDGKDQFSIKVDGLGCPFCAYGLEKKFKDFKGIKNVQIEIETGIFTFTYPSEKNLTIEAVEAKVEEAGYTAVNTTIVRTNGTIEDSTAEPVLLETTEGELIKKAIHVKGNCGMCKARIEKSAKNIAGIVSAEWDVDTKILMVEYDNSSTDLETIEAAIAKAGHDTESMEASNETYENLPACCLYER